jgi:hypothetical protein
VDYEVSISLRDWKRIVCTYLHQFTTVIYVRICSESSHENTLNDVDEATYLGEKVVSEKEYLSAILKI